MDDKYTRPYYGINDDRTYDMNGDGVFDSSDKALGAPFSYYSYDMHLYAKWEPVHRHSYVNWKWMEKNHWKTCDAVLPVSVPHINTAAGNTTKNSIGKNVPVVP